MTSVFHYHDKGRGESIDLYYEDDKIAIDTTRDRDELLLSGHEVMLDAEAVEKLIQALTTMQANIRARYQKAIES